MELKKFYVLYFKQHPRRKTNLTLCTGLKTIKQYNQLSAHKHVETIGISYSRVRPNVKHIVFGIKFYSHEGRSFASNMYSSKLLLFQLSKFIEDKQWNYNN